MTLALTLPTLSSVYITALIWSTASASVTVVSTSLSAASNVISSPWIVTCVPCSSVVSDLVPVTLASDGAT